MQPKKRYYLKWVYDQLEWFSITEEDLRDDLMSNSEPNPLHKIPKDVDWTETDYEDEWEEAYQEWLMGDSPYETLIEVKGRDLDALKELLKEVEKDGKMARQIS